MERKIFVVFLCVSVFLSVTFGCLRTTSDQTRCTGEDCETHKPAQDFPDAAWKCGVCGDPIHLVLRVRNDIVEPTFDEYLVMPRVNKRELLHHLLEAANIKYPFRFSMTHYGADLGMMVDSINGLKNDWATSMTYWKILYANGTALNKGVSTFIPEHQDEIVFEYTKYKPTDHED